MAFDVHADEIPFRMPTGKAYGVLAFATTQLEDSQDVYADLVHRVPPEFADVLNIRTYYEQRWLEEGKNIHYLRTRV